MDKALIKQHLNTIDFVMNHTSNYIDNAEKTLADYARYIAEELAQAEKHRLYCLKEALCDLDTIRQEYQKELDK